jgi:hypothetical protein
MNSAIRFVRTCRTMAGRDLRLVERLGECAVCGTPTPAEREVQRWVYPADSAEQNEMMREKKDVILDDELE